MIIGFDGSRAFVAERTGTENYSYQLLRHLAQIDKKNQYLVYLRPGNRVPNWKTVIAGQEAGGVIAKQEARSRSVIPGNEETPESNQDPGQARMTNYGWPENFEFKKIDYKRLWTQVGLGLQTFSDKLDILFVPAHTLPIIRKPGLKTVMTVHDLGAEYLPAAHQLKQRLYLRFITNYQLNSATALIAVSESTKKDLVSEGTYREKISVIYEGFDSSLFNPKNSDLQDNVLKQFDLESKKYFLFVGTIQPRKNLGNLIKAFKGFLNILPQTDIKLVLAGGKGWLSDEIFELPKKLGIEDRVKFLGRVPDQQLPVLYSGALALTYPSLYEGFGLPILEAMACGCPVIASNTSSLPEVLGSAGILVNPLLVEQILEAMLKIAENDRLRDNLIEKGNVQVKKFSWEKCAHETLKLLESLKE